VGKKTVKLSTKAEAWENCVARRGWAQGRMSAGMCPQERREIRDLGGNNA